MWPVFSDYTITFECSLSFKNKFFYYTVLMSTAKGQLQGYFLIATRLELMELNSILFWIEGERREGGGLGSADLSRT